MELVTNNLTEKGKRDYALVCKAVNKEDRKAYATLMNYYRDSVYFMLLKMTNNRIDAEDLTIEAFGKAFHKLTQYTPDYAFSTWLFKIASNNCIDFIRKKKKLTYSIDRSFNLEDSNSEVLAQSIPDNTNDPEEELIKEQKIMMMREIVKQLKPHYKKLIELRYFKEYSYEEICQEMDLPLGTVKAQLFRAREFLLNIIRKSKENI